MKQAVLFGLLVFLPTCEGTFPDALKKFLGADQSLAQLHAESHADRKPTPKGHASPAKPAAKSEDTAALAGKKMKAVSHKLEQHPASPPAQHPTAAHKKDAEAG